MNLQLNSRSRRIFDSVANQSEVYKLATQSVAGATVLDFGCEVEGGLAAGQKLAKMCLADLAEVQIGGLCPLTGLPLISVATDHPIPACLMSQYAGWKVDVDGYFAMGSGPMRALAGTEDLFKEFPADQTETTAVGILESGRLPPEDAVNKMKESLPAGSELLLAVAPTASQAGNLQVVARSVETAMHKLHEINFPLKSVQSGFGICPVPPVAKDDLAGIGRTNDAILYGATVHLYVDMEDDLIQHFGPKTPSNSSDAFGESFLTLFKQANYNFYDIDKNLFSPALVHFHNVNKGNSFSFGEHKPDVLRASFGIG